MNRRAFLKLLGLAPTLPVVAKVAPLIAAAAAPAAAIPVAGLLPLSLSGDLISAIAFDRDVLYIGGRFSSASGAAPASIARWNGAGWEDLGSNLAPLPASIWGWDQAVGENPRWLESYQMDDTCLDSPDDE